MKTSMIGGHFGEGGRYAQCDQKAYEYAFLMKAFGLNEWVNFLDQQVEGYFIFVENSYGQGKNSMLLVHCQYLGSRDADKFEHVLFM